MREYVFVFLYGALALSSLFLAAFWWRFARTRRLALHNKIGADRYYLLSLGITLNAIGMLFLATSRVVANLRYGLSDAIYGPEGVGVAFGMATILASKAVLVWVADLEREPAVWTWLKWMAIILLAWAVAASFVSHQVPEVPPQPPVNKSLLT